jgi:hypothetical protein
MIHSSPACLRKKKHHTSLGLWGKKENRTSTMFNSGLWKSTYSFLTCHESHDYVQPLFFIKKDMTSEEINNN